MDNKPLTDSDIELKKYDNELDFTQDMRKRLVESMTEDGMPYKPIAQQTLLSALDSMDNQTFKRIERAEGDAVGGAVAAEVTAFMAQLAKSAIRDPFRVEQAQSTHREYTLPDVSDATDYELSQETNYGKAEYDEFTTEFLENNPDYRE